MLKKNPNVVPPPSSVEDIAKLEREIADHLGEIRTANARHQKTLTSLNESLSKEVAPKIKAILVRARAIRRYAEAHKNELLGQTRLKSVEIPHGGTLAWYSTSPSVEIKPEDEVHIIALAKKLGLTQFVRVAESLDRQAMLKEPEKAKTISGVEIRGRKRFTIKPIGEKDGLVYDIRSQRWTVPSK